MKYNPDIWQVVELVYPNEEPIQKTMAAWYGGFAGSDSWKLNSGNVKITKDGDKYEILGYSGSIYVGHAHTYRFGNPLSPVIGMLDRAVASGVLESYRVLDLEELKVENV